MACVDARRAVSKMKVTVFSVHEEWVTVDVVALSVDASSLDVAVGDGGITHQEIVDLIP